MLFGNKVYTFFGRFLPNNYKIGTIYALINKCFQVYSNWSMFHLQLTLLREIFQKNGYLENFIDRWFKLFFNRIHIIIETVPSVKRSLCDWSFLFRNFIIEKLGLNCKSPSKGYWTVVNCRLFLKLKINSAIIFTSKILFPKLLDQVWFTMKVWIMQWILLRRMC